MSATGRGAKRKKNDNYPTPAWATKWFLDAVKLPQGHWIEPACGEGAILEVLEETENLCDVIYASDKRNMEKHATVHGGVNWIGGPLSSLVGEWDVAITNPPYSIALDFAKWGVKHARFTCLLLRLNFLAGQERSEWMRNHVPDVYVLSKRPQFTKNAKGKTGSDATEYAWLVFHREQRTEGRVEILFPPRSRHHYVPKK